MYLLKVKYDCRLFCLIIQCYLAVGTLNFCQNCSNCKVLWWKWWLRNMATCTHMCQRLCLLKSNAGGRSGLIPVCYPRLTENFCSLWCKEIVTQECRKIHYYLENLELWSSHLLTLSEGLTKLTYGITIGSSGKPIQLPGSHYYCGDATSLFCSQVSMEHNDVAQFSCVGSTGMNSSHGQILLWGHSCLYCLLCFWHQQLQEVPWKS